MTVQRDHAVTRKGTKFLSHLDASNSHSNINGWHQILIVSKRRHDKTYFSHELSHQSNLMVQILYPDWRFGTTPSRDNASVLVTQGFVTYLIINSSEVDDNLNLKQTDSHLRNDFSNLSKRK